MRVNKLLTMCILLIAVMVIQSGCAKVEPGYGGLKVNLSGDDRGVGEYAIETGRLWYMPFMTEIKTLPTFAQNSVWTADSREGSEDNEEVSFSDMEGLQVRGDIAYTYKLSFSDVPKFYVYFRTDDIQAWTDGYARERVQGYLNRVGGLVNIEGILVDKGKLLNEVMDSLNQHMSNIEFVDAKGVKHKGINLSFTALDFIGEIRVPAKFRQRIEEKMEATQEAMKAENVVRQKEAEAKQLIVEAQGVADARKIAASGVADSILTVKTAIAKGNKLVAASLTNTLVENRRVDNQAKQMAKWDGALPTTLITGETGGSKHLWFDMKK